MEETMLTAVSSLSPAIANGPHLQPSPVLDGNLRDLERVNDFVRGELEACGRDFANVAAVLVLLHLHGVDLHDREKPLLLYVIVERRLVTGVAVLVGLQPGEQVIRAASLDDLVVQRTDDALLDHLDGRWPPGRFEKAG